MFGDFENQAIFEKKELIINQLNNRFSSIPRFSLRVNCRNTPRIAELVHLLACLTPRYTMIRRPDNQVDPKIITYSTKSDESRLLQSILRQLLDEHYSLQEIVILSVRAGHDSVFNQLPDEWKKRISSVNLENTDGKIRHGTIHSFKGLEAPIIILTDVDEVISQEARSLFYTGITRALDRIITFVSEDANREISRILLGH
jgi:superfamily I DNA/RNA helicase